MKVLLTGAAGGLGSTTLPLLREAGYDVVATDRRMSRLADPDIEIADLCDLNAVYRLLKGIDVVVHVGNVPHDGYPFDECYIGNVSANAAVFFAAIERRVPRIIWASTIQVCSGKTSTSAPGPDIAYLPADGDMPGIPQNNYSLGKHLSEQTLEALCKRTGVEGVAIRFPWIMRTDWPRFGNRFHPGKSTQRFTHTLDSLLWLTSKDAARLLVACVKAEKLPGFRIYLPAAEDLLGDDTLESVVKEYFPNIPWKVPMQQFGRLCDNTRVTAETGWVPLDNKQTLEAALAAATAK